MDSQHVTVVDKWTAHADKLAELGAQFSTHAAGFDR